MALGSNRSQYFENPAPQQTSKKLRTRTKVPRHILLKHEPSTTFLQKIPLFSLFLNVLNNILINRGHSKNQYVSLTLRVVRIKNNRGMALGPPCKDCFADCFVCLFCHTTHEINMNKMKLSVSWVHSSLKNVDLVAIQSSDP